MTTNKLSVPNLSSLISVQKLCEYSNPYVYGREQEELFVEAMRENILWHAERLKFYRRLLELHDFSVSELKSVDDCANIPFIHANFFKTHEILSINEEEVHRHLTSSGTSGQKSQVFFDLWSIESAHRMVDFIFQWYGWITPAQKTNYLLYNYELEPGSMLGTGFTGNFLCKYAPINDLFYALRRIGSGSHEFDCFGCMERLQRYAEEGLPVRIFGFPSFFHFTLERMQQKKIPKIRLSEDSLVFLGGGWKGYADHAIEKKDLYNQIAGQLGIAGPRIRDGFGSVEHCIPYVECEFQHFHVPVWSRVYIRDVKTLRPLGYGKPGFLHFVSPYITSVPAQSVLMEDLASLHDGKSCPCGIQTPYFVVHGRTGLTANRSCAIAASELIKKE